MCSMQDLNMPTVPYHTIMFFPNIDEVVKDVSLVVNAIALPQLVLSSTVITA